MEIHDFDGQNRIWRAGCTVHWFLTGKSAMMEATGVLSHEIYYWILANMHKGTDPFGVE